MTTVFDFLLLFIILGFVCVAPASVNSLQCEPVAKQPSLVLKWKCPFGNNAGFTIKISKDKWIREENASLCVSEGLESNFSITSLSYFSTYNVTIVTLSSGSGVSPEVHAVCNTSITGKLHSLRINIHRSKILTS